MKNLIIILVIALVTSFVSSCTKAKEVGLYSIYQLEKYSQNKPLIELSAEWNKEVGLMAKFPKGIEVYRSTNAINNKATNLYMVVFNPKLIDLKPVVSSSLKTPMSFFTDEGENVYACINGGFFTSTTSLSLMGYNGVVSSANVKSLTRPLNGVNTTYYPTRSAFGLDNMFNPSVAWVYGVGTGVGVQYAYPVPSPNALNTAPQVIPSELFPSGGKVWGQRTVIGGSPMLVKDSLINITDVEELIEVDNKSSRPRSAIGYLKNGNVVLLAAEGGNPNGAPGLTLAELANIMLEVGCVGAVNLDGGGSSSMVVDGLTTIRPSNANAAERAVVSALIVKKR